MSQRPLEGIRILDLSRLLPGPFLTMVLADLGADVVKIEDPFVGDYMRQIPPIAAGATMSGRFLAINRDKRSLALDLKAPAGRAALLRMAARADVVIETFRPGAMERLGLGWDALRAVNPRLVYCSISGYGQRGPYARRAGHDLDYIALAGVLAMGGPRGGAPAMPGVQIADLAGGALWGTTGVLAALYGRERSGEGSHVDISMTEGALALLAAELGTLAADAPPPTRGETLLNGAAACYSVYRCADGRYLAVAALEPKFWNAFNAAIGRAVDPFDLVAPPEGQERLRGEIQTILAARPRDEWVRLLADHDCCVEPVLEIDELEAHPLHQARGLFFTLDGPAGPIVQIRTPVGEPRQGAGLPPALGQHSREVLRDYGFGDDEVAALVGPAR
jgi:alpha-methylacyl-CoA racemase